MNGDSSIAPLTAVLFCYRQEQVVEAAVRSIFEQTVQPAEIILSDDASPDGSYEVLCRLADEYDGPARIVVRKTEGPAGWFAHINACMALAAHRHVLVFAGDDVSYPQRVQRFTEEIASHPESRLIWSMMERMTPDGKPTGQVMGVSSFAPGMLRGGVGASQCWHKDLITRFGELPHVEAAEDIILPFRASLLQGLRFIPEPLVLWRDRDYRELTGEQLERTYEIRATKFRINASKVIENDLHAFLEEHPERASGLDDVKARLAREMASATAESDVVCAPTRAGRFVILLKRARALGFRRFRRLWQDQVLGLPAYLDSAYPRSVRRWVPRLVGLGVAMSSLVWVWKGFPYSVPLAILLALFVMEFTRMSMRGLAKLLWKPRST